LSLGLLADGDRAVAILPDLVAPTVKPGDLLGEPGVEELLEFSELLGILGTAQEVIVIRKDDDGVENQAGEGLGPAEDPEQDLVEVRTGPQK
jgi:hypothetical protein